MGADLELVGFDDDELAELFADRSAGLTDPDEVPEPLPEPVTVPGDVWLLGPHRLVCGDSTDAEVVATALDGATPHLMVTDPPYGVSYDPAWRNRAGVSTPEAHRQGRERRPRRLARGLGAVPGRRRLCLARRAARRRGGREPRSPAASRSAPRSSGPRTGSSLGRGDYHWQHEPCWYAVAGRPAIGAAIASKPRCGRSRAAAQDAETVHGTQKPVECMRRPIENNSSARPGGL